MSMNAGFLQGAENSRAPGPPRAQIQQFTRQQTGKDRRPRYRPRPLPVEERSSVETWPSPGKGVNGETTN